MYGKYFAHSNITNTNYSICYIYSIFPYFVKINFFSFRAVSRCASLNVVYTRFQFNYASTTLFELTAQVLACHNPYSISKSALSAILLLVAYAHSPRPGRVLLLRVSAKNPARNFCRYLEQINCQNVKECNFQKPYLDWLRELFCMAIVWYKSVPI